MSDIFDVEFSTTFHLFSQICFRINGGNMIPNTYLDFKKNDKTFYRSISIDRNAIDAYRLGQEWDSDDELPSERTPLTKKS